MAKAVIPLRAWAKREGSIRDRAIETRLRELFTKEIAAESRDSHGARSFT